MDWLSDFGHWLLLSQAGLFVGAALIWVGLLALCGLLVWRYGDVRMGPDPVKPSKPLSEATTEIVLQLPPPPPNYHREDLFPLADEIVRHMDELADAITDVLPVIDPLADVIETELIDYSTPLFYQIKRPKRFELETFTGSITRAQRERAMAARPEVSDAP